jgi:hypothetical protein
MGQILYTEDESGRDIATLEWGGQTISELAGQGLDLLQLYGLGGERTRNPSLSWQQARDSTLATMAWIAHRLNETALAVSAPVRPLAAQSRALRVITALATDAGDLAAALQLGRDTLTTELSRLSAQFPRLGDAPEAWSQLSNLVLSTALVRHGGGVRVGFYA